MMTPSSPIRNKAAVPKLLHAGRLVDDAERAKVSEFGLDTGTLAQEHGAEQEQS